MRVPVWSITYYLNEYDENDNEEDSHIGYNRFLLQQINFWL